MTAFAPKSDEHEDQTAPIFAEAKNLTNQPLRYFQGVKERTMQLEYYSYNWNVGLKYDF